LGTVVDRGLLEFTLKAMYRYGTHTNEDRAVPDYRDGFKPVFRRILWALKHLPKGTSLKTARVIGDTLGKYHPHGDAPVNGAIQTLIHAATPPLRGQGNWGNVVDPPAAPRYTNLWLSKYGELFIHPDYLAVTDFVANYDDSTTEPVVLPSLLPNIFFNGADGIGVGITCRIPSYTPKSVLTLMIRILKGDQLEIKDYVNTLEFKLPYGGWTPDTKDNRKAMASFYKTGEGSILHSCDLHIQKDGRTIIVDSFVPGVSLIGAEKENKDGKKRRGAIDKIREVEGVEFAENATDKKGVRFEIRIKKFKHEENRQRCIKKIQEIMSASRDYRMVLTERKKNEQEVEVKLFSSTVPDLMKMWLKWRVDLEIKSLDYRISREKDDIAYNKLLIHAIDNLDVVMKSLRQDDPDAYLVKHLKITAEQAKQILDLKVRQLSKMDRSQLVERGKQQKQTLDQLIDWRKKPAVKVCKDFQRILEKIGG
jgi:DNA gyrase/topoisomerase IV subunit A